MAVRPLVGFPALLRDFGFATAPEQTMAFVAAVGLLGPRGMGDIHHAALATLAPAPERRGEFDALFRAHFLGERLEVTTAGEEPTRVKDERGRRLELPDRVVTGQSGRAASRAETLGLRSFGATADDLALRALRRRAAAWLPRRRAFRRRPARAGPALDLRRTMRRALRTDGEIVALVRSRRATRQRRVLVLLDVSGSMKAHTAAQLRFAHALARAAERVELFTLGTRLTRITRALTSRDEARALAAAAATVEDWDGGTRLGEALQAFLAVPRFAGFARGAVVLVLSDALERGDHAALVDAVRRLARRAFRLVWLTPLAAYPRFSPDTAALQAILPWLDALGPGGAPAHLCRAVARLAELER
jgi:uncharacterized protein with von Willebrand factor type A (vWA) domain